MLKLLFLSLLLSRSATIRTSSGFSFGTPSHRIVLAPALLAIGLLAAPSANAQANLTFAGGSGTPLSLTLAAPVTYTLTNPVTSNSNLAFLFQGTGDFAADAFPHVAGSITYSINGGAPRTLTMLNSGLVANAITATDSYLYGIAVFPGVKTGDIITLGLGALTTTANIAAPAPASGSYSTYLTDSSGGRVSNNGISSNSNSGAAAPEPSALSLIATGILGLTAVMRRKTA